MDANAPVFTPLFARGPSQLREEVRVEKSGAWEPKIVIPDTGGTYASGNPETEYDRLRSDIDALGKGDHDPESLEQLRLLETRLDGVKQSHFFREKVSGAQFHSETLENKLHSLSDLVVVHPKPPEIILPPKHQPLESKPTEASITSVDIFDNDNGDENSGGLFEILEEIPATETTASGSIVRLQPMAVPKHWSDRLPKAILQEVISKKDKYAVVKYACISGPSRVLRANLTVIWDGGRTQSWSMDDVGCPDLKQAEEYISTVALHALTFPTLDGFALGGTSGVSTQTFFRRLPPVFRALWDELEEKRKESDGATNRAAWEKLRTIARVKLESQSKVPFLKYYHGACLTCCAVNLEALESCWWGEGPENHKKYLFSGA